MSFDKELIASKLRRWERYLGEYKLPAWDEIPDIGLYMEQVLSLMTKYLDYLPPELKEEEFITAATINNYVRRRLMPEPIKKKYYRIHIAYLIMICTLKQSLSISTLHEMVPMDVDEEAFRSVYDTYVKRHGVATRYFISQVQLISANILGYPHAVDIAVTNTEELVAMSAVISGFSKLLAEKLLLLNEKKIEDMNKDQLE